MQKSFALLFSQNSNGTRKTLDREKQNRSVRRNGIKSYLEALVDDALHFFGSTDALYPAHSSYRYSGYSDRKMPFVLNARLGGRRVGGARINRDKYRLEFLLFHKTKRYIWIVEYEIMRNNLYIKIFWKNCEKNIYFNYFIFEIMYILEQKINVLQNENNENERKKSSRFLYLKNIIFNIYDFSFHSFVLFYFFLIFIIFFF